MFNFMSLISYSKKRLVVLVSVETYLSNFPNLERTRYTFKVIRKFFLKHNKSFRWHLGDYEKHNFFPFEGLWEEKLWFLCVFTVESRIWEGFSLDFWFLEASILLLRYSNLYVVTRWSQKFMVLRNHDSICIFGSFLLWLQVVSYG